MVTAPTYTPTREMVRVLVGSEAADALSPRACGRVIGAAWAAAKRELEREHQHDEQLILDVIAEK